jgi:hypothetical protein
VTNRPTKLARYQLGKNSVDAISCACSAIRCHDATLVEMGIDPAKSPDPHVRAIWRVAENEAGLPSPEVRRRLQALLSAMASARDEPAYASGEWSSTRALIPAMA